MRRSIFIPMVLVAIVISACSLANNTADQTENNDNVVQIITATSEQLQQAPQQTEEVTQSQNQNTNNTGNNTTASGGTGNQQPVNTCVPRTDWVIYTVQAGDTLSGIAVQTNSTTDALITANCLANPNLLNVGAQLRVPRTPTSNLPPATSPTDVPVIWGMGAYTCDDPSYAPQNTVAVSGQGALAYSYGCYDVRIGQTVTLSWSGAPSNISEVEFHLRYINTMQPMVIARDSNGADGWSAQVVVASDWSQAALYAFTIMGSGVITSDQTGFRTSTINGSCPPQLGGGVIDLSLTLNPVAEAQSYGCYGIRANTLVTVTWTPYQANLTEATFYRYNTSMSRPDVFGVDSNPADGFTMTLNLPAGTPSSIIYVMAHGAGQGSQIDSGMIGIYVIP